MSNTPAILAELEGRCRSLGLEVTALRAERERATRERRINGLAEAIRDAVLEAQDAAEVDGLTPDEFARGLLRDISHILGVEQ